MSRVLLILILIFTGLQTQASSPLGLKCNGHLTAPVLNTSPRLGIGVLARDESGALLLGVSPYAGSLHDNIVYELIDTSNAVEIVWMGEVRYSKSDRQVVLHEANETSGFYSRHASAPLVIRDREIPIGNCVSTLPICARSENFQAYPFQTGQNFRLAEELREVRGDIRHSVGNSLNIISSVASIVTSASWDIARKESVIASLKTTDASHVRLVRWLLQNLMEDDRVKLEDIRELYDLVLKLSTTDWTIQDLTSINVEAVRSQIQRVSAFTVPGRIQGTVEIYRLGSK